MNENSIAIIGAGFAGISTAYALKQINLQFTLFDRSLQFGGIWTNKPELKFRSIYEHDFTELRELKFNFLKGNKTYSDIRNYIETYTDTFDLKANFSGDKNIKSISYNENHKWILEFDNHEKELYNAVVLATGTKCSLADISFLQNYTGLIIHESLLESPDCLKGKRVLITGEDSFACSLAVNALDYSKELHISLPEIFWKKPSAILGIPIEEIFHPYISEHIDLIMSNDMLSNFFNITNSIFPHLSSNISYPEKNKTLSKLLYFLKNGRISSHSKIQSIQDNELYFSNDDKPYEFDIIIVSNKYSPNIVPIYTPNKQYTDIYPDSILNSFAIEYKNLFFSGYINPTHLVGPIQSDLSTILASAINISRELEQPIGNLLQKFGFISSKNNFMNVAQLKKKLEILSNLLPHLPSLERSYNKL
ncbi:MAG: FAD-dependent oxidoreductase, partial [Leptospiraceae bacterium]|nr:FAD-dependent oxidoreductase [Leptospiraceae bacterium]